MLNGTAISNPEPVNLLYDSENWVFGQATSESTAKDIISARAAIEPLLDWLPARVAHDLCNPEDPDALGDDSSFLAVTPTASLYIAVLLAGSEVSFWSVRGCEGRKS